MVALLAPHMAYEAADESPQLQISDTRRFAFEAPKTAIPTLAEYSEISAQEAGINPTLFKRLIACESRWNDRAEGDNGTSFGLLQFKEDTFLLFAKKYNLATASYVNPHHQMDLAALMIRDGYISHWQNCARRIGWR